MVNTLVGNMENEPMKANLDMEKLDILSRFLCLFFSFCRISSNFMTLFAYLKGSRDLRMRVKSFNKFLNMKLFLNRKF